MRLLRLEDNGEFSLVEHVGRNIPQYAILSHTWGEDHDEVNFKDLKKGTGKNKIGYRKLIFCQEQAIKDDLQWFWIDTCCIDKSNSTELSEAIISMFRWYHNAAKCYAYLSDVSVETWKHDFQHSRWFTRGWTLQELIAPPSVEFFSREGVQLGNKNAMVQELHNITGISILALEGSPLSRFSVDERMSWAAKRETKREEDAAYSLLGIFGISMTLLYGEGVENASFRLRREIEQTATLEGLFRRNHGVLLDTQDLVRLQQDTMQFTRTTANKQLWVTYITMPLVITMALFSMPWYSFVVPFQHNEKSFLICYIFVSSIVVCASTIIQYLIKLFWHVTQLCRRNPPTTLGQDDIELQLPQDRPRNSS